MKKIIILLFITTVVASGCKKYLDVNNNPNQPLVVTPNVVLSAALSGSGSIVSNSFLSVNRYMGYWARSGNYVGDPINESYQFNNGLTDNEWGNYYSIIHRYDYIEQQGKAQKLPFYLGVAETMKALHYATLVDVYGDIPYTQTFDPVKHQQPKYDDAATIYKALLVKLDSAVANFDAAKAYYAAPTTTDATIATDDTYDIMFGRGAGVDPATRMDKWVQLANTIKLKLLLTESRVISTGDRTAAIAKITANGRGFIGAGGSALVNPGYSNSTGKINPFYAVFNTTTATTSSQNFFRANQYGINFYNNTGDERQQFFYGTPTPVAGNYDGDPNSQPNATVSSIGPGVLKAATQDAVIMSDFESLFMQAEAVQRGWITGSAQALYESGVTQSYVYLGANMFFDTPEEEAAYYLAGYQGGNGGLLTTPVLDIDGKGTSADQFIVWASASDKLRLIMTQKWAAMNGINWVAAWSDFRRTGFPQTPILDISKATTHVKNQIPTRYLYPQTELNTNAANVPKLPAPAQYDLIFWDK